MTAEAVLSAEAQSRMERSNLQAMGKLFVQDGEFATRRAKVVQNSPK